MSICTPRAWPGFGSHSEYGKLVPTISSVSQSSIMSLDGLVPSRPIEPVTNGSVVGQRGTAVERLGDAGAEQRRRPR